MAFFAVCTLASLLLLRFVWGMSRPTHICGTSVTIPAFFLSAPQDSPVTSHLTIGVLGYRCMLLSPALQGPGDLDLCSYAYMERALPLSCHPSP